jgi:trk system potassium uptake protein TrkA
MKFCVIGLGSFGTDLAVALTTAGGEVLAVDQNEERVNFVKDVVSHAVVLDSSDITSLRRLPLREMDAVIVAIGAHFENSVLTTALLQELGVKNLICRVTNRIHERILRLMNVDRILLPERIAAKRVATSLLLRGVLDSYTLSADYEIIEIHVPKHFRGHTLQEVNLRAKYRLNLVTVKRPKTPPTPETPEPEMEVLGVPSPDFVFDEHDVLVLFGMERHLRQLLAE